MLRIKSQHWPLLATTAISIALFASASWMYPGFCSQYQIASLLGVNASLAVVAMGMTFVILSGGIDLSVGAMLALCSIVLAKSITHWHVPAVVAIPLVLLLGLSLGGSMGAIIQFFRLPPFLVTLAGMFLARGAALALTTEKRLDIKGSAAFKWLVNWSAGDFNLQAVIMLAATAAAIVVARYTRFGRAVYALGGNPSSAMLMGLPVARTRISVYALSGFCAALASVVHCIGAPAGDAQVATLLELDAIAAVVIGGTLLSGGVGQPAGTLLGVLILGAITLLPSYQSNIRFREGWTKVAIAGLLLIFIVLQRLLQVRRSQEE
jgi:simple sugar transport system permease protein